MPSNIDVSTRRNVLPCKGITHYVLRPQPPPAAAGMIPIGGVGRHQQPALSQERPTDLPILKFSDPHFKIPKEYAKLKVQTFQLFKSILFFNSPEFQADLM